MPSSYGWLFLKLGDSLRGLSLDLVAANLVSASLVNPFFCSPPPICSYEEVTDLYVRTIALDRFACSPLILLTFVLTYQFQAYSYNSFVPFDWHFQLIKILHSASKFSHLRVPAKIADFSQFQWQFCSFLSFCPVLLPLMLVLRRSLSYPHMLLCKWVSYLMR